MKIKITVEGDYYEETQELKDFMFAVDNKIALHDIREKIRGQLKYVERESDSDFLEELYEEVCEATRDY